MPPRESWVDVSVPVREGMPHWPGDREVVVERFATVADDGVNVTRIAMSAHTGTHIDAPLHYVAGGAAVDAAPFEALLGPARVIEISDPGAITAAELQGRRIRRGERLLFKTRNSERCWRRPEFCSDYVALSAGAAHWLVERKVRTVAIDYLSIGQPGPEGDETHRVLLEAGVWVIEGVDLSGVPAGPCQMICLPLRLAGGDGAPCRTLLRPQRPRERRRS